MTYECDDPEIERELATLEWTDQGFPASVPIELFSRYERLGVDGLEACRRVLGDLAPALDPNFSRLSAHCAFGDEGAARAYAHHFWLNGLLLELMPSERLEEIRRSERDLRESPEILPPD